MTRPQAPPHPLLSPHEIAQGLRDSGLISQGDAHRLEQRIGAWAANEKAEGRREGIGEAVRRAKIAVAGIKAPPSVRPRKSRSEQFKNYCRKIQRTTNADTRTEQLTSTVRPARTSQHDPIQHDDTLKHDNVRARSVRATCS